MDGASMQRRVSRRTLRARDERYARCSVVVRTPTWRSAMNPERLKSYYDMAWPLVSGALLGVVIVTAGWVVGKWAHRLVHRACARARLNEALARFFGSMARYVVFAATLIAALGAVGIQTTSLLTVFATAGLAIGLALQGSLANFASGVLLLFFRPFDLGDSIKVAGETGEAKDIGLFATTVLTANNETIVIPNAAVTAGNITNYTRVGTRRATIVVSVAYGTDLLVAQQVLLQAVADCPRVLVTPAPSVALTGFAPSALELTIGVWSKVGDFGDVQDQVRRAVYEALGRAHFHVPFPRTLVEQVGLRSA
jgi:small conductance mechanosensitive channel